MRDYCGTLLLDVIKHQREAARTQLTAVVSSQTAFYSSCGIGSSTALLRLTAAGKPVVVATVVVVVVVLTSTTTAAALVTIFTVSATTAVVAARRAGSSGRTETSLPGRKSCEYTCKKAALVAEATKQQQQTDNNAVESGSTMRRRYYYLYYCCCSCCLRRRLWRRLLEMETDYNYYYNYAARDGLVEDQEKTATAAAVRHRPLAVDDDHSRPRAGEGVLRS